MSDWQITLESATRRHRNLRALIRSRSLLQTSSRAYATKTEETLASLAELTREIDALERIHGEDTTATRGERNRRSNQIEQLRTEKSQLVKLAEASPSSAAANARDLLLSGQGIAVLGSSGWQVEDEDEREAPSTSAGAQAQLRLDREEVLRVQDEGLDSLHDVIVRQKRMAEAIGGEVEVQNEIIEDIGDGMDQTHQRLIATTASVRGVDRRDRTCGYWTVIVLLFIVIMVLVLLPS